MKIQDVQLDERKKNIKSHICSAKVYEEDWKFIKENDISIGKIITEAIKEFRKRYKEENLK